MVHIKFLVSVIFVDLIVVLVILLIKQALVAVSIITCAGRCSHVISITLLCGSTLIKLRLRVRVKAKVGENNNLVEEKSADGKEE